MDELEKKGLIAAATRRVFARNVLTVVKPADSRSTSRSPPTCSTRGSGRIVDRQSEDGARRPVRRGEPAGPRALGRGCSRSSCSPRTSARRSSTSRAARWTRGSSTRPTWPPAPAVKEAFRPAEERTGRSPTRRRSSATRSRRRWRRPSSSSCCAAGAGGARRLGRRPRRPSPRGGAAPTAAPGGCAPPAGGSTHGEARVSARAPLVAVHPVACWPPLLNARDRHPARVRARAPPLPRARRSSTCSSRCRSCCRRP